jgi:glucose/arabinose dehydrogenase
MRNSSWFLAAVATAHLSLAPSSAQIPDSVTLTPVFGTEGANVFNHPTLMLEIPGRPGSFLVPEMGSGNIWVLSPNAEGTGYAKTLFGQIQGRIGEDDMGLTGFAFHPDYAVNRKYYVKRGSPQRPPRQNLLEERIASADGLKDGGQPERRLMAVDFPEEFPDHNGGSPVFGPDGYLYASFGDGGWDLATPDVHKNGQNRATLLGKIIRIDVDRKDPGLEYAIPADNPFVADPDPAVRREIWAYGLRNSYRFSFDRVTGELYDGDIGWVKYDEIDIITKGGNYGWSVKEGPYCLPDGPCNAGVTGISDPLAALENGGGPGQAKCVIGGHVYRGDPESPFYGVYLFGDYTLKKLFALKKPAQGAAAVKEYPLVTPQEPIAFTLDRMNNVYMVGYQGTIYKLTHEQLKPKETAIGILPRNRKAAGGARAGRFLAVVSGDGFLTLPSGLKGDWEAIAPDGTRLGVLKASEGSAGAAGERATRLALPPGMAGSGIVLLRALVGR